MKTSVPLFIVTNAIGYYLGQNIPNPFTANCDISWYMPEPGKVVIFNMTSHNFVMKDVHF